MRSAWLAVVLDVACVLVFVIIGRASHGEGLIGVASTAWPFLAGLAGGWLATAGLAGRPLQPFRLWPAGARVGRRPIAQRRAAPLRRPRSQAG